VKYPTISDDPAVQAEYLRIRERLRRECVRNGEQPSDRDNHRLAEMLAFRSPPRANTDREFLAGIGTLDKQFEKDPEGLQAVVEGAKRSGYTPNMHSLYNPSLARYEGDPAAFVPHDNPVGHIKKVCRERGLGCRGAVNIDAPQPVRDHVRNPKKLLADDIVDEEIRRRVKQEPGLAAKGKRALREAVIDKHALKL
jgi:hypothetical protein